MPTRSLRSSVLVWPDAHAVESALRQWAGHAVERHPEVTRIGYFGSYARGDWSVGSDLDVVIIVASSPAAFERRAAQWDMLMLPVPVDLLVYTRSEWEALDRRGRFYQTLEREAVWVYSKSDRNCVEGA